MAHAHPKDIIVVVRLDRFSQNIGIVAIKEGIDTTDDSAAAKFFRRMMLANGACQADSTAGESLGMSSSTAS